VNLHRVAVVVRRHWLVLWRSPHRWFEVGFWPLMDVILWGSLGAFVARQDSSSQAGTVYLLAGIVLFHVLFQVQITATTGVMEETWTRNLLNVLTTPVTELEYTAAIGFFGLLKTLLAMAALTVTTVVLFGFDLSEVGWAVLPVAWILILNGWALALVVIGLILRFGQSAEILTWGLNYVVMALSGVFFPVDALPPVLSSIASVLPTTWAFAELRNALAGQAFDWSGFAIACATSFALIVASGLFAVHLLSVFRRRGFVTRYS
jgi:ABC-2 type transport system permease protein